MHHPKLVFSGRYIDIDFSVFL